MKDLLTEEQILFTELQNFVAFKSYWILKFWNLVGFLTKKDAKIEFLDVLLIFELLLHLESNLAEIWNIASTHKGKKSGAFFFKNIVNFWFYANFTQKNSEKSTKFIIFQDFFLQNWTLYFSKKKSPDFLRLCVDAMFQISARLDSKCKSSRKKR